MLHQLNNFVIPTIEERDGNRVMYYDLFSRLLKDRIIFIGTPIVDVIGAIVVGELLHLQSEDSKKPIKMYINSPGGDITVGLAIRDTMRYVKPAIHTYCIGQCASMAAVLLAAGTRGYRKALPSSRVLIHQPWQTGGGGQQSDILLQAKEITRMRDQLEQMLSADTNQTIDKIHTDCDRDFIMTAQEAKDYGIVDQVVETHDNT